MLGEREEGGWVNGGVGRRRALPACLLSVWAVNTLHEASALELQVGRATLHLHLVAPEHIYICICCRM